MSSEIIFFCLSFSSSFADLSIPHHRSRTVKKPNNVQAIPKCTMPFIESRLQISIFPQQWPYDGSSALADGLGVARLQGTHRR